MTEQRSALDGFVLLGVVLATVAAVAFVLVRAERAALDDPDEQALRGELVGIRGNSLLAPDRLRRALEEVASRGRPGTVLVSIRMDPTGLSIVAREPSTKRWIYRVSPSLKVERGDFGQGTDHGVGPRSVDVEAPARMIAEIDQRFGYAPKELNYLVYDVTTGSPRLLGYWQRDGVAHQFTANGRGGSVVSQDARERESLPNDPASRAARERAACLERAESPAAVEACGDGS